MCALRRSHPHLHRLNAHATAHRWDCKQSIEQGIGATIDGVRASQPTVPIAVVTPTVAYYEYTTRCRGGFNLEQLRDQIRAAVRARVARGDRRLYLIEGKPLVPQSGQTDSLHPSTQGMRELALNLNAQLGMAAVRWEVMTGGCPAPAGGLALRVNGLTPHGRAALYWGTLLQSRAVSGGGASGGACRQRTLMVGGAGAGEVTLEVDAAGEATAAIPSVRSHAACASTLFQVLDLYTCVSSRVGSGTATTSVAGSAAEALMLSGGGGGGSGGFSGSDGATHGSAFASMYASASALQSPPPPSAPHPPPPPPRPPSPPPPPLQILPTMRPPSYEQSFGSVATSDRFDSSSDVTVTAVDTGTGARGVATFASAVGNDGNGGATDAVDALYSPSSLSSSIGGGGGRGGGGGGGGEGSPVVSAAVAALMGVLLCAAMAWRCVCSRRRGASSSSSSSSASGTASRQRPAASRFAAATRACGGGRRSAGHMRLSCRDDDEASDQLGDAIQAAVGHAMRSGAGTHLGKGAPQRGGPGSGGGAKAGRQSSKTAAAPRAQRRLLPGFVRGGTSGGRFSRLPTSGMPME